MTHVLHLDASAQVEHSTTRRLGRELLALWRAAEPDLTVTYRDLAAEPVPLVTGEWVSAAFSSDPTADRSALAVSEVLIAEVEACDVLVVGAPMYNFGVPAALKAWIDQVVRVGRTFGYDGSAPVGLVRGTRAVVLGSSGGDALYYEQAGLDFRARYLRAVLGFVGITDVEVVQVVGTLTGPPDLTAARAALPGLLRTALVPSDLLPPDLPGAYPAQRPSEGVAAV